MKEFRIKDKCGCEISNLRDLPKDIPDKCKIIIEPPSPSDYVIKMIVCIATFIIVTLFSIFIKIPVLYSAIIGLILALCLGGCFNIIVRRLESLFKLH